MTDGQARRAWQHAERSTRFADGGSFATLAALLDVAEQRRAGRYLLTGSRPGGGTVGGWRRWVEGPLPVGWQTAERGHYLHPSRPVLHYVHGSGRTLEVARTVGWFGESVDPTPAAAADGLRAAVGSIRSAWHQPTIALLSTPATLGRDLWTRTIPFGQTIPTLDEGTQDAIRDTTGQGRWQRWSGDPECRVDVHGFDMRFGYAALLWGLPDPDTVACRDGLSIGSERWRKGGDMRYVRGRFLVTFRVPDDWSTVGMFGVDDDGHDGQTCDRCTGDLGRSSTCWPDRPGTVGDAWIDGCEAMVAADHGWQFVACQSITFDTGTGLDEWGRRLVAARESVASGDVETDRLARAALRMILLQAVGAFHGRGHKRTGVAETAADVPDGATVRLSGGRMLWTRDEPAAWPGAAHPEWSAAVWARCRARMLSHDGRGLLHVDRRSLVACRQDAMYVAGDRPAWDDDGRVGTLRPTGTGRARRWPRTVEELLTATTDTRQVPA